MINFYYNKKKILIYLLICSTYVIASLLGIVYSVSLGDIKQSFILPLPGGSTIYLGTFSLLQVSIISIILFCVLSALLLSIFLGKKPAAQLDEKGILVREFVFVPWSDIDSIGLMSVNKQEFINIKLKNPDAYLPKLSLGKKIRFKLNRFGNYHITLQNLTIPLTEAFETIKQYMEKYYNMESH